MPDNRVIPPPGFTLDLPPGYSASDVVARREAQRIPPPPDGSGVVDLPPGYSASDVVPPPPDGSGVVRVPPGFTLDAAPAEPKPNPVIHGLKEFGAQVNPIEGIKGLAQAAAHPIDTIMADGGARQKIWNDAKKAFDNGDYETGAAKAIYSMVPFLGPNLSSSGDQFVSGDFAGGIGSSLGQAVNLAAPALLKGAVAKLPAAVGDAAQSVAGKIYKSALKPAPTANVARVASAVESGLSEGIPISEAGVRKLYAALGDYEAAKPDFAGPAGATPISVDRPLQNLQGLEARASKGALPTADVAAVQAARDEFLTANRPGGPIRQPNGSLRPLTAAEAQEMKQATQRSVSTSYQRGLNASPVSDFGVKARQGIASGLRDELAEQFPELKASNEGQAGLKSLEPLIQRRVAALVNQSRVGISTPLVSMAAHALTGSWEAGAAAGVAAWVLDNPAIRARLAIALSRVGNIPSRPRI